jgi:BirA family biotin operon repressor/biotin-[acetyl-CoA-carboxylase] ligase
MDLGRQVAKAHETAIVVAQSQTAGRGRRGNKWISNPGGLYMTWVLEYKPGEQETSYTMSGFVLAVVETLRHFGLKNCGIKEPNDVYVDGKKISGVLIDILPYGLLAGVGVNLNNDLGNLQDIATSFKDIKGEPIDVESFLTELIKTFKSHRNGFPRNLAYLIRRWRRLLIKDHKHA